MTSTENTHTPESERSELRTAIAAVRRELVSTAGFSIVVNLLMLVPVIYMLQLYDRVVPTANVSTLTLLTLVTVFLFGVMGALDWTRSQILARTGDILESRLRERLFDASYRAVLGGNTGAASIQPSDDLRHLRQFIASPAVHAVFDAPCTPFFVAVMFLLHPLLGWAAVATAILQLLVTGAQQMVNGRRLAEAGEVGNRARGLLSRTLDNAEVIHGLGMRRALFERWSREEQTAVSAQADAGDRGLRFAVVTKYTRMLAQSLVLVLVLVLVLGLGA